MAGLQYPASRQFSANSAEYENQKFSPGTGPFWNKKYPGPAIPFEAAAQTAAPFLNLLSADNPQSPPPPVENLSFVTPSAVNLLLLYSVTGDLLRNGSVDWQNPAPARAAQQPGPPPNLLTSTLSEEVEYVPRAPLYTRRFHPPYREPFIPPWFDPSTTTPVTPSLAVVRAPVFIRRFTLPAPVADVFPNLLTSTLGGPAAPVAAPFIPVLLANPGRLAAPLPVAPPLDLLGTTLAPVAPVLAPFIPVVFPDPIGRLQRQVHDQGQNLLALDSLKGVPFKPVLWVDSVRRPDAQQTALFQNLLTVDASKGVPIRALDWANPVRTAPRQDVSPLVQNWLLLTTPPPPRPVGAPILMHQPVLARYVQPPLPLANLNMTTFTTPPPPTGVCVPYIIGG